jgi:uncharacterized protein YfkK (UPF0435 family)
MTHNLREIRKKYSIVNDVVVDTKIVKNIQPTLKLVTKNP